MAPSQWQSIKSVALQVQPKGQVHSLTTPPLQTAVQLEASGVDKGAVSAETTVTATNAINAPVRTRSFCIIDVSLLLVLCIWPDLVYLVCSQHPQPACEPQLNPVSSTGFPQEPRNLGT